MPHITPGERVNYRNRNNQQIKLIDSFIITPGVGIETETTERQVNAAVVSY